MGKQRRKIAIFGSGFTSRYRKPLATAFNVAAEEYDVDVYLFNSLGSMGNMTSGYVDYEAEFLEYLDLSPFDGIIFDGEGYDVDGVADKVIRKLRTANCAVVSISSYVEDFYNIIFDDVKGIRMLIEHFIDHHKFTKIGFMSGYLTHPDARARYDEFKKVMKEHGMPEDGAGMFEGDFWFNKGGEAADYFLSLRERPEAIVCANDYMAIALSIELKKRGIVIPDDIALSGFDATNEGQEFLPHITSASRERLDIARTAIKFLIEKADNTDSDSSQLYIRPKPVYTQSCGCEPLDYRREAENINNIYEQYRTFSFNVYNSEASMLKLNSVDNVRKMEASFEKYAYNFGEYTSFFLMVHTDDKGIPAYNSDFSFPSGNFTPAIWIDKNKEYTGSKRSFSREDLLPKAHTDRCHFYYIMSVHWDDRFFGYSAIEMAGREIFSEFHNVWLLYIAMTLDNLLKKDHINKLIDKLEALSIRDGLTGMLNRRGFEEKARQAIASLDEKQTVCAMVLDMDGLKFINDEYGHYEGDRAIRAAAEIISACCCSGEIAGRAGGDEFYVFAVNYTETLRNSFLQRLDDKLKSYNDSGRYPYKIDISYGTFMAETDHFGRLEELLKVSDAKMYEQKIAKHGYKRR